MSYRLDQRDEADVRYWLGDDIRGEAGVHSGSGSLDKRSIYKPIENFRPYRYVERTGGSLVWHGTEDVGLRCGPIIIKPKKPHYVARDMADEIVMLSERDVFLEALWGQASPHVQATLELCYSNSPVPHGFEIFGDVAPLLYETRGAALCERRESTTARRGLTRLEALMNFGLRMMQKGVQFSDADLDLRTDMEVEADIRLSQACRDYTAIADAAYAAREKSVA